MSAPEDLASTEDDAACNQGTQRGVGVLLLGNLRCMDR